MKKILFAVIVLSLIGCTTTPIKNMKEAKAVPAKNIFCKSNNPTNNVIFVRDTAFILSITPAYLFITSEPNFEKTPLVNIDMGEIASCSLKEGEYVFHVEHYFFGIPVEGNDYPQKIEQNKIYQFRIYPGNGEFRIQRTNLKD